MASINDHLAEEMIFHILTWLPVLSLLRCKQVCKSWKSIISKSDFIQAHHAISLKKLHPFSLLRVVLSRDELQDFFMDTRSEDSVELSLPGFMSGVPQLHVRSCNGLIILGKFYIWNPLTRLGKLLPRPSYSTSLEIAHNVGFGFDSVSNDYKILRVVFILDGGIVAELFSVNANSWTAIQVPKEMQSFKHEYRPVSKCVCVDSRIMCFQGTEGILSFDLHDEVFGMYQYPDSGERISDVLDYEGSIAVILKSGERALISLWTLDDVGGNISWIKKFDIEPDHVNIDYVLLYLGNGQFLARDYGVGYFFYDDRKKGTHLPCAFGECMSVVQFSPSLLSLEGFRRRE